MLVIVVCKQNAQKQKAENRKQNNNQSEPKVGELMELRE